MPRIPNLSTTVGTMPSSVFSRLAHRIAAIKGERYPLHVGDTWMEPPVGARMEDLTVADHPGLHRYPPPTGHPPLLQALAAHRGVSVDRILVTLGATGAWHAVAGATLEPGEEVLVLAPYWPLFPGIVRSVGGRPVDVPFYDAAAFVPGSSRSAIPTPEEAVARAATHLTERTVALYLNSPSNPTGAVLPPAVLQALAQFARAHDLWIWADEVYELYSYGPDVVPISTFAPERTFSAFSFSKAHGLAGCRVGYVVTPDRPNMRGALRKMAMHASYAAPLPSQLAACAILEPTIGPPWVAHAKASYQAAGNAAADRLLLPRPQGGTFLFVDVSRGLLDHEEDPLHEFLVRCVDRGLVLAPGLSSGHPYTHHVRLCFTSAPPDVVARGVEVLAELLDLS